MGPAAADPAQVYKEALLIFYGKVSVYLKAMADCIRSNGRTGSPDKPSCGDLIEPLSLLEIQAQMQTGGLTAHTLVESYLARIEAIDRNGPRLNSVIELNPDALAIADALDGNGARKARAGRCMASLSCSKRTSTLRTR